VALILCVLKIVHTFFQRSKRGVARELRNNNEVHWLLAPVQPISPVSAEFFVQGFH